jgi:hypothetical protein
MSNLDMVENLIRSATFRPESLHEPDAWTGHIPFAYWLTTQVKPEIFVELGTHTGNSYFSFCQTISESKLSTLAYAIDTWHGDEHSGHYDESIYQKVCKENEKYSSFSTLIRSTFDEALGRFEAASIGILHIDGLHTYEAVSQDFWSWLPKIKPGGLVLLHDTNIYRDTFGVFKLWREISKEYPSIEFLHSSGLGVIQVGLSRGKSSILSTLSQKDFQNYFSAVGEFFPLILERDRLTDERDRLTDERDRLLAKENAILRSYSWKLTRPLRDLGSLLARKT